jgi:hypothetical protein
LLLGASDEDNLFQWTDNVLTDHLDLLASAGGNYVRNTMSDRDPGNVYAFKSLSEQQYDLSEWDEEYWNRLVFFLEETKARDMIAQLTLWDQWDSAFPKMWDVHPWNPDCNINYTRDVLKNNTDFFKTVAKQNETVLRYQHAYIDKLMSVALQYDHVLYNINNESWVGMQWECYWAEYIHRIARSQNKSIEVTSMQLHALGTIRTFHQHRHLYSYVDISQINQDANGALGQGHWDLLMNLRSMAHSSGPVPINNEKIYGSQSNHTGPVITYNRFAGTTEEAVQRFWRDLFGGCASARFHRPTDMYWGIGLSETAIVQIRSMSALIQKLNIFRCSPNNHLLSERKDNGAYCIANIGEQYAVYFPKEGSVQLDPGVYLEEWTLQWLHIAGCEWLAPTEVSVVWENETVFWDADKPGFKTKGNIALKTPGQGSWVALLTMKNHRKDTEV